MLLHIINRQILVAGIIIFYLLPAGDVRGQFPESEKISTHTTGRMLPPLYDTASIDRYLAAYDTLFPAGASADSALEILAHLFHESKKTDYAYGMGMALLKAGKVNYHQGNYRQSLSLSISSLNHLKKTKKGLVYAASAYNAAANAFVYLGMLERATLYYFLAAEEIKAFPESELKLSHVYGNLTSVLKNDKRILSYLDEADSLARKMGEYESLIIILLNKSMLYEQMEAWEEVNKALSEAKTLALIHNLQLPAFRVLVRYASMYYHLGAYRHAQQHIREAQQLKPDGDSDPFQNNAYRYLRGKILYELHDYKKSESLLVQALQTAKQLNLTDQVSEIKLALARVYEATGDYKKALHTQKEYQAKKDSIINPRIAADINELEVKYRTAEKDRLIEQNLRISERRKTLLWVISASAIFLTAFFIVIFRHLKQKHKLQQQLQRVDQLKAVMKGEEKERERISRELHDGIGSMLAAIQMNITDETYKSKQSGMKKIVKMVEDTAVEVRRISHNLLPGILEKHDLDTALTLYCNDIDKSTGLNVELHINGTGGPLEKHAEQAIYRIIQELLQNVIKHARATRAHVQLSRFRHQINIVVEDNGCGLNKEAIQNGTGLQNLQYRVKALQGYMSVDSIVGKSTTVCIEFDLEHLK